MSIKNLLQILTWRHFFWLWLPVVWMTGQLALEATLDVDTLLTIHAESNIHEFLQFFLVAAAFVIAAILWWQMDRKADRLLTFWVLLAMICCFYVAAEEKSWGQSLFHWPAPEEWAAINAQNETNLHNTSRLLNHIPRYMLQLGILIGGLILPLIQYVKPSCIPAHLRIFIPGNTLVITALMVFIAVVGQKVGKVFFEDKIFARGSEVEEMFVYYFVLLYVIGLKNRILGTAL